MYQSLSHDRPVVAPAVVDTSGCCGNAVALAGPVPDPLPGQGDAAGGQVPGAVKRVRGV